MTASSARTWRKSSYSGADNACLEILTPPQDQAPIRDSKDPQGPVIIFHDQAWVAFIRAVQRGEFPVDLP